MLTSSNLKGMHLPWIGNVDSIVNPIQELLTGDHPVNSIDRILTTVLFVDIVDSTGLVESLGDRHWLNLLETFHAITRKEIDRFRGNQIKNTGDGVLATFDGPARANSCACVLRVAAQGLGIELRSGLHTGEIQHMQSDVAGIAIHVASRVMSAAAPGEVWTTSTVRDLVSGSGIAFKDQGRFKLRGTSREWQLCRVEVASRIS